MRRLKDCARSRANANPSDPFSSNQQERTRGANLPLNAVVRPASVHPRPVVRAARPIDRAGLATRIQQNYPSAAIREGRSGRVHVMVMVSPTGRVSSCSIISSSGSQDLDEAACNGMLRYGRFEPAVDESGRPAEGRFDTTLTYSIN